MENEGSTLLYKVLEDMLSLAKSVCLLELSSGIFERESTAKHGTARHRTAPHGRGRYRMAGHDTAQRNAAPLS